MFEEPISDSPIYIEDKDGTVRWLLGVKGVGVIVLRATKKRLMEWTFEGMSIFTKDEVGQTDGL